MASSQFWACQYVIAVASLLVACDAPVAAPDPYSLTSAVGLEYGSLEGFLQQRDWQAADRETFQLMLLAADRQSEGWLSQADIDSFPCQDLNALAQLWHFYSNGKFGFLRQQEVWETVGGIAGQYDPQIAEALGEQVGWRRQDDWLTYDQLTFKRWAAPPGHLPAKTGNGVSGGVWGGVGAISGRLKYCPLMDALAEQQWDDADRATLKILSAHLEPQEDPRDPMVLNLSTLPCHDLVAIDELWQRYSNSRFGFSIQTPILQATGNAPGQAVHWGNYEAFEAAVGWDSLQTQESAYNNVPASAIPAGYFPARLGHSFATYGSGFNRTWRLDLNPTCDL